MPIRRDCPLRVTEKAVYTAYARLLPLAEKEGARKAFRSEQETYDYKREKNMTRNSCKRVGLFGVPALLAATSDAFAGMGGGTIVYGPPAESIPTLSGTMLIVLGLFLAVLAFRVLRNHSGGLPLASIVALSIAGLSGVSGVKLVQEAYAVAGYSMSQPNGGSEFIGAIGFEVPVDNTSGRAQQIKSVTPQPSCAVGTVTQSPACAPGVIVQPSNSCYVRFDCPT